MKFLYGYKSSGNETREGAIDASSRDEVFRKLKKQGIRPFRVELAPGFANRLLSFGKRTYAIVILSVLLAVVGFMLFRVLATIRESGIREIEQSSVRRQPVGDSAVIEKGIRTGWADVFADEGERFLASFAIPGVPAGVRSTTEAELERAMGRHVPAVGSDGIEARQIKSMVEGMKEELRKFVTAGGSVRQYGRLLVERQEAEIGHYRRVKAEIEDAAKGKMPKDELDALWERRNDELRRMGVKLVQFPES